jgi:hypothetical protein
MTGMEVAHGGNEADPRAHSLPPCCEGLHALDRPNDTHPEKVGKLSQGGNPIVIPARPCQEGLIFRFSSGPPEEPCPILGRVENGNDAHGLPINPI